MEISPLKVIRGGLCDSYETSQKSFISAYITDTRLMGVVGLYIHWELSDNPTIRDFHQFFYFDAEEYGLDTYKSVLGNDYITIEEIENTLIGGLGGNKVPLTLEEASFCVKEFVEFNRQRKITLPDGFDEFDFLLELDEGLTDDDVIALYSKQCVAITSPYQAANYFLMRCFAKDYVILPLLTNGLETIDFWPQISSCTLCKNTLDRDFNDASVYMAESLLDADDQYYMATSKITIHDLKVVDFEPVNTFKISPTEAAMLLARPEYISLYVFMGRQDDFNRFSTELTAKAMINSHDNGKVYMLFHENNNHVDNSIYMLNGDVLGSYYHSDSGQIIAAAYTLENIRALEKDLTGSSVGPLLIADSKYQFREPILYEYILSGFDDFDEFIDSILD